MPAKTTMPYRPSKMNNPYQSEMTYGPAEIIGYSPQERMYVNDTIQNNVEGNIDDNNIFNTYYDGYKKYLNDNANIPNYLEGNLSETDKSFITTYITSITPNPNESEKENELTKNKTILDYFINLWNKSNVTIK